MSTEKPPEEKKEEEKPEGEIVEEKIEEQKIEVPPWQAGIDALSGRMDKYERTLNEQEAQRQAERETRQKELDDTQRKEKEDAENKGRKEQIEAGNEPKPAPKPKSRRIKLFRGTRGKQ